MAYSRLPRLLASFLAFFAVSGSLLADDGLLEFVAPDPYAGIGIDVLDGDRGTRTVYPSCSGGPRLTDTGLVATDRQYSFFLREGDPRYLMIALDGGGACMDPNTCVGTALLGNATYQQTAGDVSAAAELGGIGDVENPENPFEDYTQVFVPYCTGDIFWGSRDTEYHHPLLAEPWTIHHRGYDNVLWVLSEILSYYQTDLDSVPEKVVLIGGSAGGYGVAFALAPLVALLPEETEVYVVADAASGLISEEFYVRTLGGASMTDGVWGIENNVADFMLEAFTGGAAEIPVAVYDALAAQYPDTRFGQYTTAFDAVQIFYYNLSRHIDDPERWLDPVELAPAGLEWTMQVRENLHETAANHNVRYYIGAGIDHTVVGDERFYEEDSAWGVDFRDWLDDMVNEDGEWPWESRWQNVSCVPFCTPVDEVL